MHRQSLHTVLAGSPGGRLPAPPLARTTCLQLANPPPTHPVLKSGGAYMYSIWVMAFHSGGSVPLRRFW
jgi:hypothetical protein